MKLSAERSALNECGSAVQMQTNAIDHEFANRLTDAEIRRLKQLLTEGHGSEFGPPLSTLMPEVETWGPADFPEYGHDIKVDYRCPSCGYTWS